MGPPLFCLILIPIITKLQQKYEPLGVNIIAYMDDISLHLQDVTEESLKALSDLEDDLAEVGIVVSRRKSSALPPQGHQMTDEQKGLLDGAGLTVAEEGITVVGVPIGSDDYVKECAMKVITDRGAEKLARMLPQMSDKQVAFLITSLSLTQRSAYIERGIDSELTKDACQRLDNMVLWVLEAGMGLADTEDEEDFFQEGCQPTNFKLRPYQQAQARLSMGAGGLGLPPAVMRRLSAYLGNLISTLPAVIATLRGPLGEAVKGKLPECVLVARMGDAINELHLDHGLSEEVLTGLIPPSWVVWA